MDKAESTKYWIPVAARLVSNTIAGSAYVYKEPCIWARGDCGKTVTLLTPFCPWCGKPKEII